MKKDRGAALRAGSAAAKPAASGSDRLKSFADRIDRLEEEKKAISVDVKDVYTEVKSAGYNAKALRKVLAERRRKSDAELDHDMDLYRAALGVPGATYRSVAEQMGVSKSKLHRLVPRDEKGTRADPTTGEVIETQDAAPRACVDHGSAPSEPPTANDASRAVTPVPNGGVGVGPHSETQGAVPAGAESGTGDVTTPQPDAVANTESCGPCPVPSGSVSPQTTEMASDEGVSSFLAAAPRGHALAGCDGALADNGTTTQCEDRASPGPQDTPAEPITDDVATQYMLESGARLQALLREKGYA